MVDIVPVGVRDPRNFKEARNYMIGSTGKRILDLMEDLGGKGVVRIRLRGIGSGYLEGPGGGELAESMHFNVSAQNRDLLDKAVRRVRDLIAGARFAMTGEAEDGASSARVGSRGARERSISRDRDRDRDWDRGGEGDRGRERSDSRDRHRDRDWDREGRGRERSDSRDRHRDRDWDREGRGRERSDSRDRHRDRDWDREGRGRERSISRDRDRDRDWDRGGEGGRDRSDSRDRERRRDRDDRGRDYGGGREKDRERERSRDRSTRGSDRRRSQSRSRSADRARPVPERPLPKASVVKLPFRIESLGGTFINMSICIPHPPGKTAAVEQIVCLLEQQVHAYNLTIKRLTAKEIRAFNWDSTHAVRLSGSAADCERFQSSVENTVHDVLNNGAFLPESRKRKVEEPIPANSVAAVAASLTKPTLPVVVDPRILRKALQSQQQQQIQAQQQSHQPQQKEPQHQPQAQQTLPKQRGGSTPIVGHGDADDEWEDFFRDDGSGDSKNVIP